MYCIYTDQEVSKNEGNWDHVVPISLGGRNQFCVWSQKLFNSRLGHEVDGPIASDPFYRFALRNARVKSQAGKVARPIWKNATIEGRPVQVTWDLDEVRFWDSMTSAYLDSEATVGKEIAAQFKIDMFSAVRFAAKCALGGGHFAYGDAFRRAIDCDVLRKLMLFDFDKDCNDAKLKSSGAMVCHRFDPDAAPGGRAHIYSALCEFPSRSVFIVTPHDNGMSFHVGIVGAYVGSITCNGDTRGLPFTGEHDLGHTILLGPGKIQQVSFRAYCAEFYRATTDNGPPAPPGS